MTKTLATLIAFTCCIFSADREKSESIDTYLTALHQEGKLNGNILILKDGKTVYEKSFGYADGSQQTALTKDYRFNIGSIYKEIPAVAIMQLQQQNLLQLDDTLNTHLTELPSWSQDISIKHLLQYTSGLPKINWGSYFGQGLTVTTAAISKEIQDIKTLAFAPGTDYLYSNSNPFLLIKVIESITGKPFDAYVQDHIFTPLDMTGATFKDQFPYTDTTHMAISFNQEFTEDNFKIAIKPMLLSVTASDIARWFQHVDDYKILGKDAIKSLSEKVKEGHNYEAPLGQCIWKGSDIIEHTHHGSTANYEALVQNFKEKGIMIVILTNQKNGNVYDISEKLYGMVKG